MIDIPDNIPKHAYTSECLKPEDVAMTIRCGKDILIIRNEIPYEYDERYRKAGKLIKNWMGGMKEKHCSG